MSKTVSRRTRRKSSVVQPPAAAVKVAKQLSELPGVICVVWGNRKTGTRWFREPCLSVHVKKKRAPHLLREQLIPKTIAGFRVDVLEVGTPKLHSLGVEDRINAGALGRSSATVIASDGSDALALVSGHGALNAAGKAVQLQGNGETLTGSVLDGGFGGGLSVDWALTEFAGAAGSLDAFHPAAGTATPVSLSADLVGGEQLQQFSQKRGELISGVLQGTIIGSITLDDELYTSLLSIVSVAGGDAFSVPGDSGSLIVDSDQRAVGVVVGGKSELNIFYAYDLRRLPGSIPAPRFSLFFKDL